MLDLIAAVVAFALLGAAAFAAALRLKSESQSERRHDGGKSPA